MSFASWLDETIYNLSPAWGSKRIATRKLFDAAVKRDREFRSELEAASTDRLQGAKWMASGLSIDSVLENNLVETRKRSRHIARNGFVGGAIDSRVDHSVGSGFTVQSRIVAVPGVITDKQAKTFNQQLETGWNRVSQTIDRTRKRTLWQKLGLISRCVDTDGEAFVLMSDTATSVQAIPLSIEVIDCDRVETPPNLIANPRVRMGIEYGANGQIIGYYVRDVHPQDQKEFNLSYTRYAADRICHVFTEWFAGQSRGLPWMTRVLSKIKYGDDLAEAGIVAAEVESCFSAFVKTGGSPLARAAGAATSTDNGKRIEDISPGRVQYLGPGDEVFFSNPTKSNSVGSLMEYNNRTVAAGLNWPYEMLMKDWRGVSFAGGRIVLNAAKLSTQQRQRLLMDSLLTPLWNRFVYEWVLFSAYTGCTIDQRRFEQAPHLFTAHTWTPPRWSYSLTPGEEVDAKLKAIDGNLATLADVLAEDQYDFEEVMEQRRIERQTERDYDILPTKVTQVERPQGTQVPQAAEQVPA